MSLASVAFRKLILPWLLRRARRKMAKWGKKVEELSKKWRS